LILKIYAEWDKNFLISFRKNEYYSIFAATKIIYGIGAIRMDIGKLTDFKLF